MGRTRPTNPAQPQGCQASSSHSVAAQADMFGRARQAAARTACSSRVQCSRQASATLPATCCPAGLQGDECRRRPSATEPPAMVKQPASQSPCCLSVPQQLSDRATKPAAGPLQSARVDDDAFLTALIMKLDSGSCRLLRCTFPMQHQASRAHQAWVLLTAAALEQAAGSASGHHRPNPWRLPAPVQCSTAGTSAHQGVVMMNSFTLLALKYRA